MELHPRADNDDRMPPPPITTAHIVTPTHSRTRTHSPTRPRTHTYTHGHLPPPPDDHCDHHGSILGVRARGGASQSTLGCCSRTTPHPSPSWPRRTCTSSSCGQHHRPAGPPWVARPITHKDVTLRFRPQPEPQNRTRIDRNVHNLHLWGDACVGHVTCPALIEKYLHHCAGSRPADL